MHARRTVGRLAFAVAAITVAAAVWASPAHAFDDVDFVKIDGTHVDFAMKYGAYFDNESYPRGSGRVIWDEDDDPRVTVQAMGYIDNFWGGCGKIRVRYRDSSNQTLRTVNHSDCIGVNAGFPHYRFHASSASRDTRVTRVQICAFFQAPGTSAWDSEGCKTVYRNI